jgi:hypothetical protein
VGFYLWLEGDLAWAQGAYEYRPMGAAVISASDLFRRRDFSPRRVARPPSWARQYASLGHLNAQLQELRAVPVGRLILAAAGFSAGSSARVPGFGRTVAIRRNLHGRSFGC